MLALTQLPAWLLPALQVAGGFFLLYLAWGAWRSFRRGPAAADADAAPALTGGVAANVVKAAMMNALSPSPYLFWATVAGPLLLAAWRESPFYGAAFLAGFYAALIGGIMLFILVFAGAGQIDPRVNRALGAVAAVGLAAFGLYQLFNGVVGFQA